MSSSLITLMRDRMVVWCSRAIGAIAGCSTPSMRYFTSSESSYVSMWMSEARRSSAVKIVVSTSRIIGEISSSDVNFSIEKLTSEEDISPIIRLVDTTIFTALERRASDIHIETYDDSLLVKYRIDGVLQPAMAPIAREHHGTILGRIKIMSELDIAEKRVPQDGRFRVRYKGRLIDFRVSIMPTVHGENAVLRVLDKESMSEKFKNLNLSV